MQINNNQKQILEHALGLDRQKYPYRKHYCSNSTPNLEDLVSKGYMTRHEAVYLPKDEFFYLCTEKAIKLIMGLDFWDKNEKQMKELLNNEDED